MKRTCLMSDKDEDAAAGINDVITSVMTSSHRLRLCRLTRRSKFDGFGFSINAERYAMVQRVGCVDARSPADTAGLRVNDRILEVNGLNVETDSRHELMRTIAAAAGRGRGRSLTLLVVDPESDKFFHDLELPLNSTQPFVEQCPAAQDLVDIDPDERKICYQPLLLLLLFLFIRKSKKFGFSTAVFTIENNNRDMH